LRKPAVQEVAEPLLCAKMQEYFAAEYFAAVSPAADDEVQKSFAAAAESYSEAG